MLVAFINSDHTVTVQLLCRWLVEGVLFYLATDWEKFGYFHLFGLIAFLNLHYYLKIMLFRINSRFRKQDLSLLSHPKKIFGNLHLLYLVNQVNVLFRLFNYLFKVHINESNFASARCWEKKYLFWELNFEVKNNIFYSWVVLFEIHPGSSVEDYDTHKIAFQYWPIWCRCTVVYLLSNCDVTRSGAYNHHAI